MKKINYLLFLFALLGVLGFSSWPTPQLLNKNEWIESEIKLIKARTNNIDTKVLRLSLTAYTRVQKLGLPGKRLLTVIDYSKPSNQKRLWVFDLQTGRTLFNTWVSHGKNSGGPKSTSFSNQPGSLKSSIGVFLTDTTYDGKNGYSLHLKGLERGINDNAYRRSIVIHGARYVNESSARLNGQIGRSWGCPAVSRQLSFPLINAIKNNTVVFAYYPDKKWLRSSQFLVG